MAEPPKRPVRIVIIGCNGFIGRTHLKQVLQEADCELVALVDTAPSLETVAKEHGVPHFRTVEDCLRAYNAGDLQLDAAILATPTETHVNLTQAFKGSGLAVLVEKPLSGNGEDGRKLLELSNNDTASLYMVGHHRRHSAYIKAVKNVLAEKKLGDVIAVNGVWAMRKNEAYYDIPWHTHAGVGGVLLTNAIHDFDMLQYCMGDITEVFAVEGPRNRSQNVESTVQLTFKFASGAIGSFFITDSSASPYSWEVGTGDSPLSNFTGENFLTFFGTTASISLPSLIRHHYDERPTQEKNWNFPLGKDPSAKNIPEFGVPADQSQLKHFLAVSRREVAPNCSVEDGLKAVFVVEATFRSLETGTPSLVQKI